MYIIKKNIEIHDREYRVLYISKLIRIIVDILKVILNVRKVLYDMVKF